MLIHANMRHRLSPSRGPTGVLGAQFQLEALTTVGITVRLVARLGGYMGRTRGPTPGRKLTWQGYTALMSPCQWLSLSNM